MNMLTKVGAFLGTVSFLLLATIGVHQYTEVQRLNAQPTLELTLRNVVSVNTADGYCSGWVLKGTHKVITAEHCIDNIIDQDVIVDFGDGIPHKFYPTKIGDMTYQAGPDVLVLETKDTTVKWPAGLGICPSGPYYGEPLVLFGGPLGWSQSMEFGHVSHPDVDMSNKFGYTTPYTRGILFDGKLLPGNSGGPAVDMALNCVVGQAEGIFPADPSGPLSYPYGVNFLTSGSQISEFVK
jgi:hypothetical protein